MIVTKKVLALWLAITTTIWVLAFGVATITSAEIWECLATDTTGIVVVVCPKYGTCFCDTVIAVSESASRYQVLYLKGIVRIRNIERQNIYSFDWRYLRTREHK